MAHRLLLGEELLDRICRQKVFTENDAAIIIKQILSAIAYCHSRNIVHRDIKPQNIIFESKNKDAQVKIIDFVFSQHYDPSKKMLKTVGTPYYIAPEVLRKSYNEKCDVWSCGVLLYILLVGYPPFAGKHSDEIMRNISKGEYEMKGKERCITFRSFLGSGISTGQRPGQELAFIRS